MRWMFSPSKHSSILMSTWKWQISKAEAKGVNKWLKTNSKSWAGTPVRREDPLKGGGREVLRSRGEKKTMAWNYSPFQILEIDYSNPVSESYWSKGLRQSLANKLGKRRPLHTNLRLIFQTVSNLTSVAFLRFISELIIKSDYGYSPN